MKVYIMMISNNEYNKEYNTRKPGMIASPSQACSTGSKMNAPRKVCPSLLVALSTELKCPSSVAQ
jgi:hypothetical protein